MNALVMPEAEKIPFERPNPNGWFTVMFPKVHDQNTNIDLWFRDVSDVINKEKWGPNFSTFVHGVGKKHADRISPVFFFRDIMHAMQVVWRFNGELVK